MLDGTFASNMAQPLLFNLMYKIYGCKGMAAFGVCFLHGLRSRNSHLNLQKKHDLSCIYETHLFCEKASRTWKLDTPN